MTKAAMCLTCGQIIGPRPRQADWSIWTWCAKPCMHSAVRWRDGQAGVLEVTSLHGKEDVVVVGLHNGMFGALSKSTFENPLSDAEWRAAHALCTNAPGYLFDKSRRECWAALVRVGESNDVWFVEYGLAWQEKLLDEKQEKEKDK